MKKNTAIRTIILCGCALGILLAHAAIAASPNITWKADIPGAIPLAAMHSYTTQVGIDAERQEALIQSLTRIGGLTSQREKSADGRFLWLSDNAQLSGLEIDQQTGAIIFSGKEARDGALRTTPNLPDSKVAPQRARQHLKALKLLPGNLKDMVVAHVGGESMAVVDEKGVSTTYEKLRVVRFGREIDGIPVQGPGSRIIVSLGKGGQLAGLIWDWAELQSASRAQERAKTISRKEARNTMLKRIATVSDEAKEVVVTQVKLVFFDDDQGVIEPAYHVEALRTYDIPDADADTSIIMEVPYDFYVPVLKATRAQFPDMDNMTDTIPLPSDLVK